MRRAPRADGRSAVDLPGPFPLARPAWTNPPGQREIVAQRPQRAGGLAQADQGRRARQLLLRSAFPQIVVHLPQVRQPCYIRFGTLGVFLHLWVVAYERLYPSWTRVTLLTKLIGGCDMYCH